MTDTPETDAAARYMGIADEWVPRCTSEKLESERDEALQLLCNIRSRWEGLVTVDGCDCEDCEFLRPVDSILNKHTTNQND